MRYFFFLSLYLRGAFFSSAMCGGVRAAAGGAFWSVNAWRPWPAIHPARGLRRAPSVRRILMARRAACCRDALRYKHKHPPPQLLSTPFSSQNQIHSAKRERTRRSLCGEHHCSVRLSIMRRARTFVAFQSTQVSSSARFRVLSYQPQANLFRQPQKSCMWAHRGAWSRCVFRQLSSAVEVCNLQRS
jgi:hypothetical protein